MICFRKYYEIHKISEFVQFGYVLSYFRNGVLMDLKFVFLGDKKNCTFGEPVQFNNAQSLPDNVRYRCGSRKHIFQVYLQDKPNPVTSSQYV